eukprot:m.241391 g.241391  ORF g.241391 m.241391 type:complete len:1324 (-) comp21328_c0_seq1:140-4111(-)
MSWLKKKFEDVTSKFSEVPQQKSSETFECTMCIGNKFSCLKDLQDHYLLAHTNADDDDALEGREGLFEKETSRSDSMVSTHERNERKENDNLIDFEGDGNENTATATTEAVFTGDGTHVQEQRLHEDADVLSSSSSFIEAPSSPMNSRKQEESVLIPRSDKKRKERAAREVIRLETELEEWRTKYQEEKYHNDALSKELDRLEGELDKKKTANHVSDADSKQEVKFLRRENVQLKSRLEEMEKQIAISSHTEGGNAQTVTNETRNNEALEQLLANHKAELSIVEKERDGALLEAKEGQELLEELFQSRDKLEQELSEAKSKAGDVSRLQEDLALKTQCVRSLEEQVNMLQNRCDADEPAVELESLRTCLDETQTRCDVLQQQVNEMQTKTEKQRQGAVEREGVLSSEVERLQRSIKDKEKEMEVSKEQATALSKELQVTNEKMSSSLQEASAMQTRVETLEAEKEELNAEMQHVSADFDEAKQREKATNERIVRLTRDLQQTTEEKAALVAALESQRDTASKKQTHCDGDNEHGGDTGNNNDGDKLNADSISIDGEKETSEGTATGDEQPPTKKIGVLEQAHTQISELRTALSEKEGEIVDLQGNISTLQSQKEALTSEMSRTNVEHKQQEQELEKKHGDLLDKLNATVSTFDKERESLVSSASVLKATCEEQQQKIQELEASASHNDQSSLSTISEQGQRIESLESELSQYTSRIADLMKKNSSLVDEVKTLKEDVQMSGVAVTSTQETLNQARNALNAKEDELQSLKEQLASTLKDLNEARQQHKVSSEKASIVDEKEEVIQILQNKIAALQAEKGKLNDRVHEHQHACQTLQTELEDLRREKDQQLGLASKERKSLSEKVKTQIKQLDEASHENDSLRERLATKMKLEEEVESQIKEVEDKMVELQAKMVVAEEMLALPCEVCREYEVEVETLNKNLGEATSALEEARNESNRRGEQFERMQKDLSSQSSELERLEQERDQIKKRHQQTQEHLEMTKKELEGQCSSQTTLLHESQSQVSQLQNELSLQQEATTSKEQELAEITKKLQELESKLGEQVQFVRTAQAEREDAMLMLEETKAMFVKTKITGEKGVKKLQSELTQTKEALATLQKKTAQSQHQLQQKVDALRSAYDKEVSESAKLKETNQRLQSDFNEQASSQEEELTLLRESITSSELKADKLQAKIAKLEQVCLKEEEKAKTLQVEKEGLLKELMNKNKESNQEIEKLKKIVEDKELGLLELTQRFQDISVKMVKQNESTWVRDKEVKACQSCHGQFGIKKRRHHCRKCGGVFCNACSMKTAKLPSSKKPERVCDACYKEVQ